VFNKLYRSRIDSESEILRVLLNANQAVRYHKLQGYGLKDSDFDKEPNCSRRIFNHRKKELLNSYCIRTLKQSDGRSTYYQITPIGIIRFCQHINEINELPFTRVFDVLKFYYNKFKLPSEESYVDKLQNSWEKLSKDLGKNWNNQELFKIIKNIEILNQDNNQFVINLKYRLFHDTDVSYAQYVISENRFMVAHYPIEEDIEIGYDETTEEKLYYLISKFILKAIFHSLIYNRLMFDYALEENIWKSLRNEEYVKKNYKKFPIEFLGVADEFNDELRDVVFLNSQSLSKASTLIGVLFGSRGKQSPHYKRTVSSSIEKTNLFKQHLKRKNN